MRNTHLLPRVAPGALLVCLLCAATDAALAQDPGKTTPPVPPTSSSDGSAPPGPATMELGRYLVGDPAPDVKLNDQTGRTFHLTVERRTKPWLLVFVRRPQETVDIEAAAPGLHELGIGAVVLAPFGRDRQLDWVKKPTLPLLTDRASVNARNYGTYDAVTSNPRPGAFLIDKRGRIAWMISGGLPSAPELVRMTREALEAKGELPAAAGTGAGAGTAD